MRIAPWLVLFVLLLAGGPAFADSPQGERARLKVDDAPLGGKFTLTVVDAATLQERIELPPGPGRLLAVRFAKAEGRNPFLIPGDLAMVDAEGRRWSRGFLPLTEGELAGRLGKEESRWALWWIPRDGERLGWEDLSGLTVHYGTATGSFEAADVSATLEAFPWDRLFPGEFPVEREASELIRMPNPAMFDTQPLVLRQKPPEYPKSALYHRYEGTVHVAAVVDHTGKVIDAYVVLSNASHDLNVSALAAVMQWEFRAGKKNGEWATGEVVVPVRFSLKSLDQ